MGINEILDHLTALEGVLVLRPVEGDGSPPIAWGDAFAYDAPDGQVPPGQPFATVVTKDYPDEETSWYRPGSFRLNIALGKDAAAQVLAGQGATAQPGTPDAWTPHPVYGRLGWVCVVDPGPRTREHALQLVDAAHAEARSRHQTRRRGEES